MTARRMVTPSGSKHNEEPACRSFGCRPVDPERRVYLAGPMRGLDLYGFPLFDDAAAWLRSQGYCVISPAELDRDAGYDPARDGMELPDGFMQEAMARDIDALLQVDAVALLPGWEGSSGVAVELTVARALGLDVYEILDGPAIVGGGTYRILVPLTEGEQTVAAAPPDPSLERLLAEEAEIERRVEMTRFGEAEPVWLDIVDLGPDDDATNPKDRIGTAKPQVHLVPPAAILHVAKAMENGAAKYGAYNWREKDVRLTVYIAAAMRHLFALLDGEDVAADSGVKHLGHVGACAAILLDAEANGNLIDDRPPAGPAARVIDQLTEAPT
jgi:hypothetical protein